MDPETAEPRADAPRPKGLLRDYTETILVCVIFVIFSRTFVFQQSKIPTGSMMDTLLVGDYIMVNRFVYSPGDTAPERALLPLRPVRRGDVVVFKWPVQPEVDYIKRVVGLPGEVVELRDGILHVDGRRIDEPYVKDEYRRRDEKRNFAPVQVLPGHYLMFGDHRNQSQDSRVWKQVPQRLIKGRALLIWWSFEEDPSDVYMPLSQRLASWGKKIRYFGTRTRWERCFDLIR